MTEYHSIQDLLDLCSKNKNEIWENVVRTEMEETGAARNEVINNMQYMLRTMAEADAAYDEKMKSGSGMAGGDGAKMQKYNDSGRSVCSPYMALAMEKALKMGESNACMRRIVAAPTAGSCGVIPAVLLSYGEIYHAAEEQLVQALFVCAGIGRVIAENASIAGASGGCQAEIGSASAMAAGGLAYLQGGSPFQVMQAMAFALKNMLGLTCDPVGGLVEVPCIKRNVAGAVNAISSAQVALAGIVSAISPDDVIDSMRRIGDSMPACLKETGTGGLAVTDSAREIIQKGA